MKKFFAMAFVALTLAACSDNQTDNAATDRDDSLDNNTTVTTESSTTSNANDSLSGTSSTTTSYTAVDGDVTYSDKKVRIMRNSAWVDADKDVTLDDGTVVYRTGRVKKENREITLNDGEVVNRTGNFFDKSGRAIENAWDATKEGARKAANAVEKGAEKVGEKAKKAVQDDDHDH